MTTKNKLVNKAHIFTLLIIVIQPIMDIISFWFDKFGISGNITLVLRLGVLAVTILYAYIITDKKALYWIAFGVIVLLYAGHLFAIYQAGIKSIFTDFSNYVRVVQMPICAICVISLLRANKRSFDSLQYGMAIALNIMLGVMIISVITGTDPGMYRNGTNFYNSGILGWFNNTNSQSSNLCVLLPVSIVWQLLSKKRNNLLLLTTTVLGLLAMYFACTRLAYLGIVAVTVGIGVIILIIKRTDWKYSLVLLALGMIFVALIPVSPMTAHLNIYNDSQSGRQEDLVEKIDDIDEVKNLLEKKKKKPNKDNGSSAASENNELTEEEIRELVKQLKPVYKYYISDFVQIFGLRETMEMYDFTTDVKALSALREKKINFAEKMLADSPDSTKLFGIEYSRFIVDQGKDGQRLLNSTGDEYVTEIYDVENDFHGIYYLYGWAGLGAYILFLGYFVYLVLRSLLKNIKKYFTLEACAFGIGFLLCMAHAYNTAGVLRRPNASIYLSLVLAAIYYLVKVKEYEEPQKKVK